MSKFLSENSDLFIFIIIILETLIAVWAIVFYIRNKKKTLYSFKNASLLGGSIFMVQMLVYSVAMLHAQRNGANDVMRFISNVSQVIEFFPTILLPFSVAFFLFMGFSNISLLRHESRSMKNLLGSILGFGIVGMTIARVFWWDSISDRIIPKLYEQGNSLLVVAEVAIPQFLTGLLCYLECLLIGTTICGVKAARHVPAYDKNYVIILGCAIAKEGQPLPLLRGRIDRALEFAKKQLSATGKKIKFVTSGGRGSDECISESESMQRYLVSKGVSESDILMENKSVNTLQNMEFSRELIEKDGEGKNVIFSITNYHVYRSGMYANEAGLHAEGIGSKTKWYFWSNAFIREFIALLVSGAKKHAANVVVLLMLSLMSGCAAYASMM